MASVSPARLSSLSTATLTRILELTRARQLIDAPPPPASLSTRITNDLGSLHAGITALEADPSRRRVPTEPRDADAEAKEEMLSGLKGQYGRLVGLARDLGLEARDIAEEEATEESDLPAARLTRTPMPASNVRIDLDDQGDADEDEEAMKRANQDVMMMQRGMIDRTSTVTALSGHDLERAPRARRNARQAVFGDFSTARPQPYHLLRARAAFLTTR